MGDLCKIGIDLAIPNGGVSVATLNTVSGLEHIPQPLTPEFIECVLAEAMMVPKDMMRESPCTMEYYIPTRFGVLTMDIVDHARMQHIPCSPCQPFRGMYGECTSGGTVGIGTAKCTKHVDSRVVEVKQLTG